MKKIFAKKSFGQNFLVDKNYIDKTISALAPQAGEMIIEIGAGRGALTEKLIESGANVIAVELERDMISVLNERFGDAENFQLIEADALKVDFKNFSDFKTQTQKFRLVANLPYYISTAILQKLIEQREYFSEMILMFQREVAERITAPVGNSQRGFLTVLVEAHFETNKLFDVPPSAFYPIPKVWSSTMRLITKGNEINNFAHDDFFKELVSISFRQKRKTILNNLKNASPQLLDKFGEIEVMLESCGVSNSRRAETLTIEEWKCLYDFSVGDIFESAAKIIHGEKVFGKDVDAETRCAHYHSELDIIAINFKCCGRWFPCFECHKEIADHQPEIWEKNDFDSLAVLCGGCGEKLRIDEYFKSDSKCPVCRRNFNPNCAKHYQLYFEM